MQIAGLDERTRAWEEEKRQREFVAEDNLEHSAADLRLQLLAATCGLDSFKQFIESHTFGQPAESLASEAAKGKEEEIEVEDM